VGHKSATDDLLGFRPHCFYLGAHPSSAAEKYDHKASHGGFGLPQPRPETSPSDYLSAFIGRFFIPLNPWTNLRVYGPRRSGKARIPFIARSGKTGALAPTTALTPQGGGEVTTLRLRINNYLLRLIFLLKIEEETRSRIR